MKSPRTSTGVRLDSSDKPTHECDDGCDIPFCLQCGEDFSDPCPRHLAAGHTPSTDPYSDGADCSTCCQICALVGGADTDRETER